MKVIDQIPKSTWVYGFIRGIQKLESGDLIVLREDTQVRGTGTIYNVPDSLHARPAELKVKRGPSTGPLHYESD